MGVLLIIISWYREFEGGGGRNWDGGIELGDWGYDGLRYGDGVSTIL